MAISLSIIVVLWQERRRGFLKKRVTIWWLPLGEDLAIYHVLYFETKWAKCSCFEERSLGTGEVKFSLLLRAKRRAPSWHKRSEMPPLGRSQAKCTNVVRAKRCVVSWVGTQPGASPSWMYSSNDVSVRVSFA